MTAPLDRINELLPARIRGIVERETPIPSIASRAAAMQAEHPDLVRADIGQISGFDSDLEVLYGPPVGLPELRRCIAETWTLGFGLEPALAAESVALCTGAAEALALLFHCFAHGKTVALPRGHWENYRNGVELAGGRVVTVDYFDAEGRLDLEGLKRCVREEGVAVLVANFPCNPTGAVLDAAETAALARTVRELDVVCLADEVYARLRFDGHRPVTLLAEAPDHVVTVCSASKEYLLPGARTGYVLSAHQELTDRVLRKLIRANSASPNVLGQRLLLERMGADLEDMRAGRAPSCLSRVQKEMARRRDALVEVLERHDMAPTGRPGQVPSGTIFLMASLPGWWEGDDRAFAELALEAGCVSSVPGSAFGIPNSVRLSYGGLTPDAIGTLDRNLERLRATHGGK